MTQTDRGRTSRPLWPVPKHGRKERCKGNDDTEREVENAHPDCAEQRQEIGGVEEEKGGGGMTWAAMKASPSELIRRQAACDRMNILYAKRNRTDDPATQKRLDREIDRIRRAEAPWLKDVAYWLY